MDISSVTGMELLAGLLLSSQLSKAEAFLDRLGRQERIVTPVHEEWLRAGKILARYQSRFGHVEPADHVHGILILLVAERMGAELAAENGAHFRLWSKFRPASRRPRLVVLDRQAYLN